MTCNNPVTAFFSGFDNAGKIRISYRPVLGASPILMDCGSCLGCRLKKSKEWAVRCLKELEYYNEACFVTLTYNNLCLPRSVNTDTGEIAPSLVRKHIVQFVKRLRISLARKNYSDDKIKVYYCGEYGDSNHRPHYHLLIFGYKPNLSFL